MAGFEIHREPEDAFRLSCPLAATQTYVVGDPLYITGGQLTEAPADETEVADGELVGFAAEPATGITAGSRATATADGFGAATNDIRSYFAAGPGLLLRTKNLWDDETASPPTRTAITGNLRGSSLAIIYALDASVGDEGWGLNTNAATAGTDAVAIVVDVLDGTMQPVTGTDTGIWLVFAVADHVLEGEGA